MKSMIGEVLVHMKGILRTACAAIVFLTIIPIPWVKIEKNDLQSAHYYFPLTGLIIGVFLLLFVYLIAPVGPVLGSILAVAFLAIITRGLHYDGLADTADGLFGGTDKAGTLEIMKDSSIGAFGMLAVLFTVVLKIAACYLLIKASLIVLLIAIPLISRAIMLLMMYLYPYVGSNGLGSLFINRSVPGAVISSAAALGGGYLVLIYAGGPAGALYTSAAQAAPAFNMASVSVALLLAKAVLVALGGAWLICNFAKKKIEGLTGDTYGAAVEISEVTLACALAISFGAAV